MKVVRHGKPAKEYLATLRSPTRGDYGVLLRGCLEAIIRGDKDVLIAFAYILKFPDDFPRGIRYEKVDDRNFHRVKASKLLAWLNKHGHTDITMDMLKGQLISFGHEMGKWEDKEEDDD